MSTAEKQFRKDCGNAQRVSIAKMMLLETGQVEIDGAIKWSLIGFGSSQRIAGDEYDIYLPDGSNYIPLVDKYNDVWWAANRMYNKFY